MLYGLTRPLIFRMDAEQAHRLTILALKYLPKRPVPTFAACLGQDVAGLHFPSPIGLAAGFDKNGEVPDAMLGLGFGFVEIGTVTPMPQEGNEKPRLFRLTEDRAVINRMGFNNDGQDMVRGRVSFRDHRRGIMGVNIGANKDSEDRIGDYRRGVVSMSPYADYLTVNISSPNTPGLRQLQSPKALKELLKLVRETRGERGPPIFLKVAPDLAEDDPARIARVALASKIDGIIVSNTTIERPEGLRSAHAQETGGLSGRPLKAKALEALRAFAAATKGKIPLIAAGGIETVDDVWDRMRSGASLVQLYSALVYEGPGLAMRLNGQLAKRLEDEGIANIADIVGADL
ncbi:quinone-dependent dihydroorotate dehydrogenase [Sphingomicrobium astaxanthinifaciens]|uniref:quinone-dependent dihydroorotate dehydrogenase n=1 Tax=Sphingomicrobium astaxanthinifaciens TaxID=1227949 RepID=UPI001FCA73F7|nr:quinone-dependent dihydroorotate dehydrogenase [Sphingomicrobium astaxanthinifaciens]MCJ7421326.1 quinone-dependent dihydroorotate dehydrogenase [Sphingomicrobium astaxanthinifaciens]